MQAKSISFFHLPYDEAMKAGRPAKSRRVDFGARVYACREAAGLTQQQVAEQLGITQASYALWERRNVALKASQIAKLAEIFGVTTDELIIGSPQRKTRGGPRGKARRLFERVSALPRSQQLHVLTVVEAFVEKQAAGRSS